MIKIIEIVLDILCLFFLPFLFIGQINRTKSFLVGRKGPSVFQPFYDFIRFLNKGEVISTTTSFVFQIAPSISLASAIFASLVVPLINHKAIISFEGDFVLFLYILAVGRFFSIIGAMDTGSSFEGMGASREGTFSALVEPAFFIIIASIAGLTGNTSFAGLLSILQRNEHLFILIIVLSVIAFFIIMLAEGHRIPVDDPDTHLELTMIHEVMILDNSGPDLGLILYTAGLRLILIGSVIANLVIPIGEHIALSYLLYIMVIFLLSVLIGCIESSIARLRMTHIPQFIFLTTSIALIVLSTIALFVYGELR